MYVHVTCTICKICYMNSKFYMEIDIPGSSNDGSTNGAMNECQQHEGFHDPAEDGVAKRVTHGRHPDEDPEQLHQDGGTAQQIDNLLEEDQSVDAGPLGW